MSNAEKIFAFILSKANPGGEEWARSVNCGMVGQIWHDGEVTMTKAGNLWNQRTLHCMVAAFIPKDIADKINDLMRKAAEEGDRRIVTFGKNRSVVTKCLSYEEERQFQEDIERILCDNN